MKRLLTALLLFGALLGLFGAELAYAHAIPATMAAPEAMTMDADCMAMMATQQPAPAEKPCKGLTLECIAAMGCVVPLIAEDQGSAVATPLLYDAPDFWSTTPVLAGQNLAPDPEPPTILG
ncbi:hypothetical protein A0J57_00395 [Sphingobium sp. 22B]|uniref:hypothetical protein n=1 Tax=unclassified Sphingobium TaxID=2611147 RepID=UPI0005CBAC14|nr:MULTISPECIES: hypothetical protein [unclassified Sphingobium]OAP32291.1 hypothetical protein A8O16_08965 [Sphingobium sp. 20006FA]AJR25301.1 hypothetical protein TZ53_17790 [Sphingobium sp. YBL2]KXU33081.1 hypothetical protein AXW74_04175 [Sphingobium sp. AM]KYC33919.1 hypothetical protein A0J57_00395 [Sphingobium sp. 22B]UXC91797.1 hypothetical protein EGM87_04795 [Sphingobium sp. RSMS]